MSNSGEPPPPYSSSPPPMPPRPQPAMLTMSYTANIGLYPTVVRCPSCKSAQTTVCRRTAGSFTYLMCMILLMLGYVLCCFCPFCIDDCLDVEHYCSSCGAYIGSYSRM